MVAFTHLLFGPHIFFGVKDNNVLNNRNIVTYAYEQSRLKSDYDRSQWPARYTYAQGTRVFVNVGIRF